MDGSELNYLRIKVQWESTHCQWIRQLLCIILLGCLIVMNLLNGSSSMKSIAGIEKCSAGYWSVIVVFIGICGLCTFIAVKLAAHDQNLKLKYGGVNVTDSDIRYSNKKQLSKLILLGFVGGWVAGALGLGGGSIYNPALLALGIPPKVSSATGLFLVTFSTFASVVIYFLNSQLDILYGLWIGFFSCVGMLAGLLASQYYMQKTGRQSIIVWCLVVIFVISTIAIPTFGVLSLTQEAEGGLDLWAFSSLCQSKQK